MKWEKGYSGVLWKKSGAGGVEKRLLGGSKAAY